MDEKRHHDVIRHLREQMGFVFQFFNLFPHLTVLQNLTLAPLRVQNRPVEEAEKEAMALLNRVGLGGKAAAYPESLSGGQKQRVGIARALAMEPKVLLMDEPFGALDALTRASLQDELMRIVEETKATTLMVTHDVDEAVLLSDRIVMMTNGPAATIGEILDVDLPRPRDRLALAEDPHYHHLRGQVLAFLYQKHHKQAA